MKRSVIIAMLALSGITTGTSAITPLMANAATKKATTVKTAKQPKAKQIKLQGAINVRDLGGYRTKSGKTIKKHKLLRSAALNTLTKKDAQKLVKTYHLATDIDLRTDAEAKKSPDVKIKGVKYVFDPVMHQFSKIGKTESGTKVMETTYSQFVTTKTSRKAYHQLFKFLLTNPKNKAVLWHCSAGKDRAGMGSVLVLSALGVDRKTINKDFLLSNKFRATTNKKALAALSAKGIKKGSLTYQRAKEMNDVKVAYLNTSYHLIKKDYGSMHNFLIKGIGLTNHDIKKLQQLYLK
ncbi:Protein tyrosine/serine phosphatase [Lactobacillus zymae] [Lactiplantibacillus mudanjiangensis]|uniref:tyrosine-protein phosphatase n=1 Tax=Lactiplantibacillus mudanjiangensis TaxID=1296538 RepID=UPI0010156DDF|nr:tyrosine-protein phosphatase [Lactiplantibacillus mudanjiangensis]VDG31725.1 Protein tyrosine/serine phosphatase [Lactobacillus zymae] [Lactiplantibacillus mudanjiangensis]